MYSHDVAYVCYITSYSHEFAYGFFYPPAPLWGHQAQKVISTYLFPESIVSTSSLGPLVY